MLQQLLLNANRGLPLLGLLLFVLVFIGIVFRTYGRKATVFSDLERLPLEDDESSQTRAPRAAIDAEGGRRG